MPNSIAVKAPKFGELLRLERAKRGRTHAELAQDLRHRVKATGLQVSPSQIVAIEQGRIPSWPLLAAYARVFDLSLSELVLQLVGRLEFPGSRDLLDHPSGVEIAEPGTSGKGGMDHDDVASRALAEELRSISNAFESAITTIADRLDGGVENPPTAHEAAEARRHASGRLRRR